jgi:ABC-type Na+ efflux pump permease subunit
MHDTLIQLLFVVVGAALAALYGKVQYDELTSEPIFLCLIFAVGLPFLITSVASENQLGAFLVLTAWVAFLTPVSKTINEMVVKEAGMPTRRKGRGQLLKH